MISQKNTILHALNINAIDHTNFMFFISFLDSGVRCYNHRFSQMSHKLSSLYKPLDTSRYNMAFYLMMVREIYTSPLLPKILLNAKRI